MFIPQVQCGLKEPLRAFHAPKKRAALYGVPKNPSERQEHEEQPTQSCQNSDFTSPRYQNCCGETQTIPLLLPGWPRCCCCCFFGEIVKVQTVSSES